VIGSSWRGIAYLKGPYKKRTKKISVKEKLNRIKFAKAQAWLQPILYLVKEGFKGYSERAEGFIAAKSYLLKNAFEGPDDNRVINPALAKISAGNLPLPPSIGVAIIAPGQLEFTWDPKTVSDSDMYDQVMLLAYDVNTLTPVFKSTGEFRKKGSDILPIDKEAGITYHLYFALTAADRSRQSDSLYMGTITT
jgi:hypothetical protein